MPPYRGYLRPFRIPRAVAFEPRVQMPGLSDLAPARTAPGELDPEQRREFAARAERVQAQRMIDAARRRQRPGEMPELPRGPNEIQEALGQARQAVGAAKNLGQAAKLGVKVGQGLFAKEGASAGGVFPGESMGEISRSPGLADVSPFATGAPLAAPVGSILDLEGGIGPGDFGPGRGFQAPAPTGPIPGGAEVSGDVASSGAEAGAEAAGLGLGEIGSAALQSLPWLAAALRIGTVAFDDNLSDEQKAVASGGAAASAVATPAISALLSSLAPAAAAAPAVAGGASAGATAGAAAGGATAAGVAAGGFGAIAAMGIAFAVDHLLDMMEDVPHRVREGEDFNKLGVDAEEYARGLSFATTPEELYGTIKGRQPAQFGGGGGINKDGGAAYATQYDPPDEEPIAPLEPETSTLGGVRMVQPSTKAPEPVAPSGSKKRKFIGNAYGGYESATLDELFRHPEAVSVHAQRGIAPQFLEKVNTPLTNLIRNRLMLFALAKSGYGPALKTVEGIGAAKKQWFAEQAERRRLQQIEDEELRRQSALNIGGGGDAGDAGGSI